MTLPRLKRVGSISTSPAHTTILKRQSEASFMAQVIACAALNGWWTWHDVDSRKNVAGLPDLLCIRERVVWIETKRWDKPLRPAQVAMRDRLRAAGQEWYRFDPGDWNEIERVLARKGASD